MLTIPKEYAQKINEQAEKTYPEECCGIMIGTVHNTVRIVDRLYQTQNIHDDNRARRFMISPDDYREAEKVARENNTEIIGFYHSHPDHPAVPSEHDREYAWPWYHYAIVEVQNGNPSELHVWKLRDDRSEFEKVHVDIS